MAISTFWSEESFEQENCQINRKKWIRTSKSFRKFPRAQLAAKWWEVIEGSAVSLHTIVTASRQATIRDSSSNKNSINKHLAPHTPTACFSLLKWKRTKNSLQTSKEQHFYGPRIKQQWGGMEEEEEKKSPVDLKFVF